MTAQFLASTPRKRRKPPQQAQRIPRPFRVKNCRNSFPTSSASLSQGLAIDKISPQNDEPQREHHKPGLRYCASPLWHENSEDHNDRDGRMITRDGGQMSRSLIGQRCDDTQLLFCLDLGRWHPTCMYVYDAWDAQQTDVPTINQRGTDEQTRLSLSGEHDSKRKYTLTSSDPSPPPPARRIVQQTSAVRRRGPAMRGTVEDGDLWIALSGTGSVVRTSRPQDCGPVIRESALESSRSE
ncbi:hypothetical protein C8F01DRAFT_1283830 [Mycena amicta]|nr:hypothetical protein C8F01DRAFT_1283830 [Mycena amicta]